MRMNVGDDVVGSLDDQAFAVWLAGNAGSALMRLRAAHGFDDPSALRAAADKASHDLMLTELARWRPTDAVMSEEGAGSRRAWSGGARPARLDADRVWIIDPLDGTREFSEEGRADWAVHVALWQRAAGPEGALTAGAVGLPARDVPAAHRTGGLVLGTDTRRAAAPAGGPIRVAVSRTRPPSFVARLVEVIGGRTVPMGSAGAKVCAVVTGEVEAYVHAGGQYEWDSAAPVAVAVAAGLHASRIDGSPLHYNRPDPRLPDLLVCRPEIVEQLLVAIAFTGGGTIASGSPATGAAATGTTVAATVTEQGATA
jgi:3'(2'), 5'-bisphosphate nucleotidase